MQCPHTEANLTPSDRHAEIGGAAGGDAASRRDSSASASGLGDAAERRDGLKGLTPRWEVCVRAGGLAALALRRSEVLVLDTRGVASALQVKAFVV